MTKLPQLPEEIIGYILSFAPNFREKYKKCHAELLENKPIYYSRWNIIKKFGSGEVFTLQDQPLFRSAQVKYINGLGRRVIWPRSIEISPLRRMYDGNCRYITYNYGWGREKDHESWKAVLKGEAGRKNLTTGYH